MIETPRLRLRPWREDDKPRFAEIINTPGMMAHFGGVKARAEIDALIDRQIVGQAERGFCFWAVELSGGELAGICGLSRSAYYSETPVAGLLEIGWRIAEPLWGQGYAKEAAQAALDWGWANTGDALIAAWTHPDNERSWGLMRRLGMARRPDLDFHHPFYPPGDPVGTEIVYSIGRPR